jgi:hypothetical protein
MVELGRGNIEHITLPSGLHSVEEDFFGFRHGTGSQSQPGAGASDPTGGNGNAKGKGKGDATWPGVALFRSRMKEGGRGRRMISLGVILGMSLSILCLPMSSLASG